jgi:hypothetical protein
LDRFVALVLASAAIGFTTSASAYRVKCSSAGYDVAHDGGFTNWGGAVWSNGGRTVDLRPGADGLCSLTFNADPKTLSRNLSPSSKAGLADVNFGIERPVKLDLVDLP